MKTIVIIGGSSGIGKALLDLLLETSKVICISRSLSGLQHGNLQEFSCDILKDDLPKLDIVDALIYCPGSINLKPFHRLTANDFLGDFSINVLGAVRVIHEYLPMLKKSNSPNVLLFSTVAVKMGMPFHASIACLLYTSPSPRD